MKPWIQTRTYSIYYPHFSTSSHFINQFVGTMFISASKDTTAKLWDMDQLENKKTYKTERPVNSAAISPNKDHVVLGGGQVRT